MEKKFIYYSELNKNERTYYYSLCRSYLEDLSCNYPRFDQWFENLFDENQRLHSEREILFCLSAGKIAGLIIIKDTPEEKKICTLRVSKWCQRQGIGRALLKRSIEQLGTKQPLITVHQDQYFAFTKLFKEFGFILRQKKYDYYSFMGIEYVFNGFLPERNRHSILLPIHTPYADLIYQKIKKYEFRKKIPSSDIDRIYLYETKPAGLITGVVEMKKILKLPLEDLWQQTREYAGIDKSIFNDYFEGYKTGYAYQLGQVFRFSDAFSLEEFGISSVMQSFRYLSDESIPFDFILGKREFSAQSFDC